LAHLIDGSLSSFPKSLRPKKNQAAFCRAFTFAHIARCAAAIFFREAADMVCLGFTLPACFAALFALSARGSSACEPRRLSCEHFRPQGGADRQLEGFPTGGDTLAYLVRPDARGRSTVYARRWFPGSLRARLRGTLSSTSFWMVDELTGTYEDGAPKPNSVGSNSPALPVNVSSKDARLSGSSGPT